jgi:NTE family protein
LNALVGREFGNYGALDLGYRRFTGHGNVIVGDPQPDFDFDIGEAWLEGSVDRLDSLYFPRDGYIVRSRYTFSRESLGADTNFEQFDLDALDAKSFGNHALQAGLRYHVTTSGAAPIQSLYRLGGYSRLAGFQPNELTGQDYFVLIGGYQYKLGNLFLGQKAYAGGTIEYGNAFQKRSDMGLSEGIWNGSAYVGIDSVLGPILFGAGAREGGHRTLFLVVGQRF